MLLTIKLALNGSYYSEYKASVVPRVGETVSAGGTLFKIDDVIHDVNRPEYITCVISYLPYPTMPL